MWIGNLYCLSLYQQRRLWLHPLVQPSCVVSFSLPSLLLCWFTNALNNTSKGMTLQTHRQSPHWLIDLDHQNQLQVWRGMCSLLGLGIEVPSPNKLDWKSICSKTSYLCSHFWGFGEARLSLDPPSMVCRLPMWVSSEILSPHYKWWANEMSHECLVHSQGRIKIRSLKKCTYLFILQAKTFFSPTWYICFMPCSCSYGLTGYHPSAMNMSISQNCFMHLSISQLVVALQSPSQWKHRHGTK